MAAQNFAQIEQEMAQLVEENKHFTTPSKFLNEFPVALKAENEKTREELEKMQDCGKQMGVLALNAAIEAGRMGEGGKQFVTAAETIRVSAGTYDELIDQAHKKAGRFRIERELQSWKSRYTGYKYSSTHQTSTADQYSYQPIYNSGNDRIGYSITNLCHVLSCQYNPPCNGLYKKWRLYQRIPRNQK